MAEFLEMMMMVFFGLSWPINIVKDLRSRTAKGKSLVFGVFVVLGYTCGLMGKILSGNITYVVFFYVLNTVMVSVDFALTLRNYHLDLEREKEKLA